MKNLTLKTFTTADGTEVTVKTQANLWGMIIVYKGSTSVKLFTIENESDAINFARSIAA